MKWSTLSTIVLATLFCTSASAGTISKVPFTITKPGKYVLLKNLTAPATTPASALAAITVTAKNVEIDLNGFSLIGNPANTSLGAGILIQEGSGEVRIRNGRVSGFTNSVTSSHVIADLLIEGMEFKAEGECLVIFSSRVQVINCGFTTTSATGIALNMGPSSIGRDARIVDRCRFIAAVTGTTDGQYAIRAAGPNGPTTITNCNIIGFATGILGNNTTRIANNLFQGVAAHYFNSSPAGYNQ
jgi:hypothetical protein